MRAGIGRSEGSMITEMNDPYAPYGSTPAGHDYQSAPAVSQYGETAPYQQQPYGAPPAAQYGAAPYAGYAAPQPPKSQNSLAIVALIVALVVAAPIGAILGHVALGQIKQTGEDGAGIAKAAIWVGWGLTILAVLVFGGMILLSIAMAGTAASRY